MSGFQTIKQARFKAVLCFDCVIDYATSAEGSNRHLLTVEWEQCDFEIGHKRNYSEPSTWHSPPSSKGWVVFYCALVIVIFVG